MTDERHLRLRCLELARPMFPVSADIEAMKRAAEEFWKFVNAPPAPAMESSGNPIESSDVQRAKVVADALTPPTWEKEA